jgi:hypothetical protein
VKQVSPVCRVVGTFRLHGHAGVNRVRFGGRVHGTQLGAGTYRVTARTRAGTVIAVTTLVIVDAGAPSQAELTLARESNVCGSTGILGAAAVRGSLAAAVGLGLGAVEEASAATIVRHQRSSGDSGKVSQKPSSPEAKSPQAVAAGPLSDVGDNAKSPIVIALLGLAVLMLGLAAVPRSVVADPRVMALVASHRVELAAAGTAALFAAVVAMLIV